MRSDVVAVIEIWWVQAIIMPLAPLLNSLPVSLFLFWEERWNRVRIEKTLTWRQPPRSLRAVSPNLSPVVPWTNTCVHWWQTSKVRAGRAWETPNPKVLFYHLGPDRWRSQSWLPGELRPGSGTSVSAPCTASEVGRALCRNWLKVIKPKTKNTKVAK